MKWICCNYEEMSKKRIWEMYHIRAVTFSVAQKRIFVDADKTDLTAHHVLGIDDHNHLVAYARFYVQDQHFSFGRVLTVPEVRGQGLGKKLVAFLLKQIKQVNVKKLPIKILSQADKQGFYEKFGFIAQGNSFIHEQTPHIVMTLK